METFEEYKKTLHLYCEDGLPAILNWTVPLDAPDLLYYQVNVHIQRLFSASHLTAALLLSFGTFSVTRTEI